MKKATFTLFFVLVFSTAFAQVDWENISTNISVGVGGNYAGLFGSVLSKDFGGFLTVELHDTISGFGIGGYRLDNISQEKTGRVSLIDLYWSKRITSNTSLWIALEKGSFDNWSDGEFVCPYTIISIANPIVNFNVSPMYCYYYKTKTDEVVLRIQAKKEIIKGTEVQLTGWYKSSLDSHYYASMGVKQQFPKNIYLQGDLLYKENEFIPLLRLGVSL
jgi:hypothetical protein